MDMDQQISATSDQLRAARSWIIQHTAHSTQAKSGDIGSF
jgi:hypothetical protein